MTIPQAEAPSADIALARAIERWGLAPATLEPINDIAIQRETFGAPAFIVAGRSQLGGAPSRLMINIVVDLASENLVLSMIEAPDATWERWGGVAAALGAFGFAGPADAFDADFLAKAGIATPTQDSEIFEAYVTAKIRIMMDALVAQQMSTLSMMRQMNADLSTETACIVTPGCKISRGPDGAAEMSFPPE